MPRELNIFQLNTRKQRETQYSIMNDEELAGYDLILLAEPYTTQIGDKLVTVPRAHRGWRRTIPTVRANGRWPIRSMIWSRRDLDVEQIPIQSSDLTGVLVRLGISTILVVSVYIQGGDQQASEGTLRLLDEAIVAARTIVPNGLEIVLAGDFNQHDTLWGGDNVTRQGEAESLVQYIADHSLSSLLPRGTTTWQNGRHASTIDLVLASAGLAKTLRHCRIHHTEHGSDHRAIETAFTVDADEVAVEPARLLWKNAPWKKMRERVAQLLWRRPGNGTVQEQADKILQAVNTASKELVPKANPSPHAKRWWTQDLTALRREYTRARNLARSQRRAGNISSALEATAKGAAKRYHDSIRKQRNQHWEDFLSDHDNIWQATKYLSPFDGTEGAYIPKLTRGDGSQTTTREEQAEELLQTFFPPLPRNIQEEESQLQRPPVLMPKLTEEEIERALYKMSPWKAGGDDGLPVMVWRQLWPTLRDPIRVLFQLSLDEGVLPTQWLHAKIVPLQKPGKDDYTRAKAWRPISLLASLGKLLEAVVAERISYAVETYGLLPANHFGGRKKRSSEHALLLLQENIYAAWRRRQVLSIVSFDVKGAYNGVYKERLLQRLTARGIPESLTRWIGAFCSNRTASIVVNGQASKKEGLPQAGLPQGSPLSPILFLFFNADLVQQRIDQNGGAIAFIDDYTVWVTGPTAQANSERLQQVINRAEAWEARSGATFEQDKTALIHFTRARDQDIDNTVIVKGHKILPQKNARILGVVMDSQLRYREHINRASTRGLRAAMALKRLRNLSPRTARMLYEATVTPTIDYAATVWQHQCGTTGRRLLGRAQRVGAQAVTGCFRTVSLEIAEAEASLQTTDQRHIQITMKAWSNICTLPGTHPVAGINRTARRRFKSPLQKIAERYSDLTPSRIETIYPYVLAPWAKRLDRRIEMDREKNVREINRFQGTRSIVGVSARHGIVGIGGAIQDKREGQPPRNKREFSITIGERSEQNLYTAELAGCLAAVQRIDTTTAERNVEIYSSNLGMIQALTQPRLQSGQWLIEKIYQKLATLYRDNYRIRIVWVPGSKLKEDPLGARAKANAKKSTRRGQIADGNGNAARSTTLRIAKEARTEDRQRTFTTGREIREIDYAVSGRHIRKLYDALTKDQARILVQLRTGMIRLNKYLFRISAAETEECECSEEAETREHFLFRCKRWDRQRRATWTPEWLQDPDISLCLGGKKATDNEKWTPDIDIVQKTIAFAAATGRLDNG